MTRKRLSGRVTDWVSLIGPLLILTGCLGGGGKADLYRFGEITVSSVEVAPEARPTNPHGVVLGFVGSTFPRSVDERLMTVTGGEISYIAHSRWVAPPRELFNAAVVRDLERIVPGVSVVRSRDLPPPDFLLAVDVRHFEARYSQGARAAPEVLIDAYIKLVRRSDRRTIAEWPVTQAEVADANRVTAIVAAFDRGTAAVTARIAERVRAAMLTGLS